MEIVASKALRCKKSNSLTKELAEVFYHNQTKKDNRGTVNGIYKFNSSFYSCN